MTTNEVSLASASESFSDRDELPDFNALSSYIQFESQPVTPRFFDADMPLDETDMVVTQRAKPSGMALIDGGFFVGSCSSANVPQPASSGPHETYTTDAFANFTDHVSITSGIPYPTALTTMGHQSAFVDPGNVSMPMYPVHHTPPGQTWKREQEREISPLDILYTRRSTGTREEYGQYTPPDDESSDVGHKAAPSKEAGFVDGRRRTAEKRRSDATPPSTGESNREVPPSKRRRGSKVAIKSEEPEDPEDGVKRDRFLERNRLAAAKCRQKKKVWTEGLEERGRNAQAQNTFLRAEIANLRNELMSLKGMVLTHVEANCGCTRIREYVGQAANVISPSAEFTAIPKDSMLEAIRRSSGVAEKKAPKVGSSRTLVAPLEDSESNEQKLSRLLGSGG
ncbi:hypothetical protein B0A49_01230 [Cryomyces minteri]|uniref:BZIP domain-containing protein n=1 Tax=Cryomyces minteri TaxID=331657 RepID=A0A4U0XRW1_9PEZI|nr:hypothetical protein B0A49_01230 [Cryomyces minteri]